MKHSINTYQEALEYLESLNKFGWSMGLVRIEALLQALGNPHTNFKTIHVGGTNGKGSVVKGINNILMNNGYKVGKFISPEMFDLRERMEINNSFIPKADFVGLLNEVRAGIEEIVNIGIEHPTNFEVWTAMMFLYFSQEGVDFGVIEVGLGGEIDSTNVITPILSIITNVSMDHTDYLGSTLMEIVSTKCGIIKEQIPLITGSDNSLVLEKLKSVVKEKDSNLLSVNIDFKTSFKKINLEQKMEFQFEVLNHKLFKNVDFNLLERVQKEKLSSNLIGTHQLKNLGVIIAAALLLSQSGVNISFESIEESLGNIEHFGRFQIMNHHHNSYILDVAHNEDGALNLAKSLNTFYKNKKFIGVVGILDDKDKVSIINHLKDNLKKIIITVPNYAGRNQEIEKTREIVEDFLLEYEVIKDVNKVIEYLNNNCINEHILITGSIYTVKEFLKELR